MLFLLAISIIIITIFLAILGVLILTFPLFLKPPLRTRWESRLGNHSQIINYLITLISTFAGAFLALVLTSYYNEADDKDKSLRLLKIAIQNLHSAEQTTYYYNPMRHPMDFLEVSPPTYPEIYFSILKNENVLNQLNPEIYSLLLVDEDQMKTMYEWMKQATTEEDMMRHEYQYNLNLKNCSIYCLFN